MRLAVTWVQFACNWRPLGYNLHATGSHLGTIYMQLANLACGSGPLRAKPLVFANTLQEKIFELKNEDTIKKSENLHSIQFACDWLPLGYKTGDMQTRGV
jgi:hypothetical protein